MSGLVLTIRIALVRVAFAIARHLPLRPRVVLATAHSPRLAGNLAAIADDLAARHPEIPVVTIAHRPATGARGRIAAAWQAVVAAFASRHFAHLDGGSTDRVIDELIVPS